MEFSGNSEHSSDEEKWVRHILQARTPLSIEDVLEGEALRASRAARADLRHLLEHGIASPPHVLIVDDEPVIKKILAAALKRHNFRPSFRHDIPSAMEVLSREVPQVMVIDVHLGPSDNGLDLLSRVLTQHPEITAIMISGGADADITIEAMRRGAMDFLFKPFRVKQLVDSINKGLERQKARLSQLSNQLRLEEVILERSQRLITLNEELVRRTQELERSYSDVIHRLGRASQWRDDETGEHIRRIGLFSGRIASRLGFSKEDEILISEASPMHDIGKIGVPDSILLKPGPLTLKEFEIMKGHTLIGAEILAGSDVPVLMASEQIALCHHEHFDGSGYPRGLKGQDIPLMARIVTVADVYDALIHPRPYKEAHDFEEAIDFMKDLKGTKFDPAVFEAFLLVVEEFPQIEAQVDKEASSRSHYGMEVGIMETYRALSARTPLGVYPPQSSGSTCPTE